MYNKKKLHQKEKGEKKQSRKDKKMKQRNEYVKTQLDPGVLYAIGRIKEKQNGEYTNIKNAMLAENVKRRNGGMK